MISTLEKIVNDYPHSIVKPQNVFTIDNPDILVPTNGNLIGVFFMKKKEIRQLDLLLRRVYMSKLAYTSAMTPIVLVDQDSVTQLGPNEHETLSRYQFICEYKTNQDISLIFKDVDYFKMDYFNPNIQNKVIRRLWLIKSFTHECKGLLKQDKFEFVSLQNELDNIMVQSWGKNKRSSKNMYLVNGNDLFLERESKQGFVSSFDSILTYTMMYNYRLDNGYMLENRNNGNNRYLNTNWNFDSITNSLYVNTLALLGILPIKIDNIDSLKEIGAKYEDYYWHSTKKRNRDV